MILNIRGTSGQGKTTIARAVMAKYPERIPIKAAGLFGNIAPDKLIGYVCQGTNDHNRLGVIGKYETACGGCDTLPSIQTVYDIIYKFLEKLGPNSDILYEGLVVQSDTRRAIELAKKHPMVILTLNESLEICQKAIQARRDAKGSTKSFHRDLGADEYSRMSAQKRRFLDAGIPYGMLNTAIKNDAITRLHPPKFQAAGVDNRMVNREEGMKMAMEVLGWTA
jgi:hypothetical protein